MFWFDCTSELALGLSSGSSLQLLLSGNVLVQLGSVLSNRVFVVVIDWNFNRSGMSWFIIGVVELGHIRVSQSLL